MSKLFLKFIVLIFGLIGFIGCDDEQVAEYAMPYAEYKISGQVKTLIGEDSIKGISVGMDSSSFTPWGVSAAVIVETDVDGNWSLDVTGLCSDPCKAIFQDIDATDNGGTFQEKSIDLTLTQTAEGSGDWDEGVFEQHDIVVEMREEE